MNIGIFSLRDDLHAHAVRDVLRRRFGSSCSIIEAGHTGGANGLTWTLRGNRAVVPDSDGMAVALDELDGLWLRRTATFNATLDLDLAEEHHHDFVNVNSVAAVAGVMSSGLPGVVVDPPAATAHAENKVVQLLAAERAGLSVPNTIVSQNPEKIRDFADSLSDGMIVKALRSTRFAMAWTGVVTPEMLADEPALSLCPSIYQELIPGSRHIRAHVFGDHVLAAMLTSDDLDWRGNVTVPIVRHEMPDHVIRALRHVLGQLGLSMGIFDLKLTEAGDYVWLEVNPQGQFLFIEGLSGLPLTSAMAQFLYDSAVR